MSSVTHLSTNVYKLTEIVKVFKAHNIELHPSGIWEWDDSRKKTAIDAKRTDGLALSKHPKDNMFKHRAELSGVAVIDCDGVPLDLVDTWYQSSIGSFYTTTSKFEKQHRYLYPPKGKTFPESRAIKDVHKDLDIITTGIVFEAHDYLSKDSQFTMNNTEIKRCTMDEYDRICAVLKPKTKTPKQNKKAANKNPIIASFNKKFSCEELLMAQGYLKIHDRLIHPESESGIAGIIFFDDGCVYSHSSDWLNDGSSHDAFDIYAHYEWKDDKGMAMSKAKDLLNLNYYGFEKTDELIDYKRLRHTKSQIGFDANKSKFYMLNRDGKIVMCPKNHLWDFIEQNFPPMFDVKKRDISEKEAEAKAKIESVKYKSTIDLMNSNSFSIMDYSIDPFAKENSIKLTGNIMRVVSNNLFPNLDLNEIKYDYNFAKKVHQDFKSHFPELPQILDLVVASRFGADRKKAFVYTQMVSDFGKSFLGAVFARLGLLVEMNEKELKKVFSGDPVGMDATEFQTAWILFFDEFKSAVGELKNITHQLTLSPKNQLRQTVQLYTKWFASKEPSQSLLGNGGVDTQFANRFAMIDTGSKTLVERELFKKDNNAYLDGLTYALYVVIKNKSDKYITMGKAKAGIEANKVVDKFRSKYALKATLDDNAEDLVEEMLDYLLHRIDYTFVPMEQEIKSLEDLAKTVFDKHEDILYLKRTDVLGRFFDEFAENLYGNKSFHKISHRKEVLRERFGTREQRTTIMIDGKKANVYPLLNKDGSLFDPIIDG